MINQLWSVLWMKFVSQNLLEVPLLAFPSSNYVTEYIGVVAQANYLRRPTSTESFGTPISLRCQYDLYCIWVGFFELIRFNENILPNNPN